MEIVQIAGLDSVEIDLNPPLTKASGPTDSREITESATVSVAFLLCAVAVALPETFSMDRNYSPCALSQHIYAEFPDLVHASVAFHVQVPFVKTFLVEVFEVEVQLGDRCSNGHDLAVYETTCPW